MKDYLEKRREELRKQGGFTLMEMLIVVAIIAVLIAIAIPVFTSQLENARDATSVANMRSAYAEAQTAYITKDTKSEHAKYTGNDDGTATVVVKDVVIESQQDNDWSGQAEKLPFASALPSEKHGDTGTNKKHDITFKYSKDGEITEVTLAPQS